MAEQKVKYRYKYITLEALQELSNEPMTYQDMADCFATNPTAGWIKKLFCKNKIKKKSFQYFIAKELDSRPNQNPYLLAEKYGVTDIYVFRIKRNLKDEEYRRKVLGERDDKNND